MRSLFSLLCLVLIGPIAAASFPKPEPEQTFAELKICDAQGRPWRVAVEDWDGARRRVAADPAWNEWLKKERAAVDAWIARHRDRVEWSAGWSHDGVSPKDASRVIWTDKIPREEAQFFSSPSDPKIEITPKLFGWWVVTFRNRHVDIMVRAARLFRLTGEERYATWVCGQMDFYADNLLRWQPVRPDQGARLFWQTLSEASGLVVFTEAVRLLGERVSVEQRERWREKFFKPEVEVINRTFQTIHNIAVWQRCAAAQVALLFGDDALWREALDGKFGLRRQLAEGITSDYLWFEQSLAYNAFVVRALLPLFKQAGLTGRAQELSAELKLAANLMLAPIYLRFPDGHLPSPADGAGGATTPDRALLADACRVLPTTLGLTEVAGRRDWDALLDPPSAPPRATELPAVPSRNLETSRMAILRDGPWQVFFHYGQLTASHSQSEALNYSASYGETEITRDPGTVGYGSPLYRGYYTRGLCHNVPLLNGEGQKPPQAGELLSFSAQPARVSAAQPHYLANASARRTLAIEDGKLIDTAQIASQSGAQKLGLALHVQGKARLPGSFAADDTLTTNRPKAFGYWQNVRSAIFRDQAEFDVVYNKVTLRVTLVAPGEFRLWHGSSPDIPPHRRESFYLELTSPAESATFTTTFAPAP
ncbi:MAG: heparinase II/III family protein [Opitutae bacterium]|nr:heparinase II/III family protein [Opitutae bacterium]